MKTPGIKEIQILSFKTANTFEKWLAKNHNKITAIWLRFFKKDSGKTGITYKEAVDEALAHYSKVIELNPNNANAYYNSGTIMRSKGDNVKANEYFDKARSLGFKTN